MAFSAQYSPLPVALPLISVFDTRHFGISLRRPRRAPVAQQLFLASAYLATGHIPRESPSRSEEAHAVTTRYGRRRPMRPRPFTIPSVSVDSRYHARCVSDVNCLATMRSSAAESTALVLEGTSRIHRCCGLLQEPSETCSELSLITAPFYTGAHEPGRNR